MPLSQPESFLEVRVHRKELTPSLCGLCVGYEDGVWRSESLAEHIFEWLPEFALTPSEHAKLSIGNCMEMVKRAARNVYQTKKFKSRGEFGELFLHAIIRQVHDSLPAISKLYYKSGVNETVKGFDAVHVVGPSNEMELWLGEAKFYEGITKAINAVAKEIHQHIDKDYLRNEFICIKGKVDQSWDHAPKLMKLLSGNTSLDVVFRRACIPVLLTYDSKCVGNHTECSAEYLEAFEHELTKHHGTFAKAIAKKKMPSAVRVHLFLMPLHEKKALVAALDRKLRVWQSL